METQKLMEIRNTCLHFALQLNGGETRDAEKIIETANMFYDWINNNEKLIEFGSTCLHHAIELNGYETRDAKKIIETANIFYNWLFNSK